MVEVTVVMKVLVVPEPLGVLVTPDPDEVVVVVALAEWIGPVPVGRREVDVHPVPVMGAWLVETDPEPVGLMLEEDVQPVPMGMLLLDPVPVTRGRVEVEAPVDRVLPAVGALEVVLKLLRGARRGAASAEPRNRAAAERCEKCIMN